MTISNSFITDCLNPADRNTMGKWNTETKPERKKSNNKRNWKPDRWICFTGNSNSHKFIAEVSDSSSFELKGKILSSLETDTKRNKDLYSEKDEKKR